MRSQNQGVLPKTGGEMTSAENGGGAARFLSLAQRRILAAACARLVPADDNGPGAVEAGAVDYIDGLLGAFLVYPPRIWAGGPFSGRFGGEAPFASFHPLTAVEALAWRPRFDASKGIAERVRLGPAAGLQERDAEGLAALGEDFPALPPEE